MLFAQGLFVGNEKHFLVSPPEKDSQGQITEKGWCQPWVPLKKEQQGRNQCHQKDYEKIYLPEFRVRINGKTFAALGTLPVASKKSLMRDLS